MTQEPVKDREEVFAPDGTRLHRSMKLTGKTIRGRSAHPKDTIRWLPWSVPDTNSREPLFPVASIQTIFPKPCVNA